MNEVEEIKNRVNIVDFIGQYLTLKKAGANYKALCPFHDERTPSFMVSPERQIFKCFGCGAGGDVIEFLMKHENLEFREALELLADKVGIQLKGQAIRPPADSQINKSTLYQVNMACAQLWHKILVTHPVGKAALQYLRGRKIYDSTLKLFLIGYAPSQDTTRTFLNQRRFSAEQIKAAGSPDKFFKRIMFPLFDVLGNVVAFTGRATAAGQEPKYLNTPETSLYHKSRYLYGLNFAKPAIKKLDRVIVVEGQMDVLASHQAGVTQAVAASGTALTRDHLTLLSRYSQNVVFAFDRDEAGVKAAKTAIELALDLEINIRLVAIPQPHKDVGELVEKTPQTWAKIAAASLPWMEWLVGDFQFPISNFQLSAVEEKKKIAKEILPFLARVKDPIEQAHWIKRLGAMLGVKEQAVADALARIGVKISPAPPPSQPAKPPLSLQEELYGVLLCYPQFQDQFKILFKELKIWYNGKDSKQLELEISRRYQGISPDEVEKAIVALGDRIRETKRAQVKSNFAEKIAAAEATGDFKKVKQLFEQLHHAIKETTP